MHQIPKGLPNIAKRRIIVYKPNADPSRVKHVAETIKIELFVTRFSKPRAEDIQIVSIDRYYKPYVLVDAKYSADFYKRRVYVFDVDKNTEEVRILGKKLRPEIVVGPNEESRKVIKLETQEFFTYENRFCLASDKYGREISLDQIPTAFSEDNPEILQEISKKVAEAKISTRKMINMVKTRIAQQLPEADGTQNEDFQVFEEALIISPVFEITFRNVKTGEEKTVKIDGVTCTPENQE